MYAYPTLTQAHLSSSPFFSIYLYILNTIPRNLRIEELAYNLS